MALSAIGEGCHQQMEGILNEIVNFVLLFLQDPVSVIQFIISKHFHFCSCDYFLIIWGQLIFQHPRVRYAACNAIGQMATDFAPGFQKKFHEKVSSKTAQNKQTKDVPFRNLLFCKWTLLFQVIAALLQTMEDQDNQRVQAHAAAALINFTEDCPKSLLIPYLDNLVKHLHSTMVIKLQEV